MGQRWSMLKNRYLEESESEEEEEGDSVSLAQLQQSQATTEASSSVPAFERGLCSTCPNDIELSNLQSGEATVDTTRRGKEEACATPTSHNFSSVKLGSLKLDSQAPRCRLRPQKKLLALDRKLEAYREALHGQFAIRKLPGANINAGAAVQSPSLTSDVAKFMELAQNEDTIDEEDEMLLSPVRATKVEAASGKFEVGRKRKLQSTVVSQPYSPAQTLLMFQLERKRKRSGGLPSLAFDCTGCHATHDGKLKARTPLERPSEGDVGEAVLDLGTGDAMVGRCVKKVVEGQHERCKGRVSCYNAAQRLYQIKYDDGKEETLEWLDLEPHLIARGGRTKTKPKYKTVDELVYTKRKRPGRQVKRR